MGIHGLFVRVFVGWNAKHTQERCSFQGTVGGHGRTHENHETREGAW